MKGQIFITLQLFLFAYLAMDESEILKYKEIDPIEYVNQMEIFEMEQYFKCMEEIRLKEELEKYPCKSKDSIYSENYWNSKKCETDDCPIGWYCDQESCGCKPQDSSLWEFTFRNIRNYTRQNDKWFWQIDKSEMKDRFVFSHRLIELMYRDGRLIELSIPLESNLTQWNFGDTIRLFPKDRSYETDGYVMNYKLSNIERNGHIYSYFNCNSVKDDYLDFKYCWYENTDLSFPDK